tara:strand:+ start:46 stop:411 length:366 start_codon:yes stop_codon:yes gene_type:complete
MNRILLVISIIFLVSCSKSLSIQLDPEVSVFLSNDRTQSLLLTPKDKEYVTLNEWLRTHSSGWHPTSGRYPGGVYLISGNYGIQIIRNHVIIYSTTSAEPKAIYIQKVGGGELSGIMNIGK